MKINFDSYSYDENESNYEKFKKSKMKKEEKKKTVKRQKKSLSHKYEFLFAKGEEA